MSDDERQNRVAIVEIGTMIDTIFRNVAGAAQASITDGSPLTGAPGQPVDTGALKNSWQLVFDTPDSAVIGTNFVYAEAIEDGVGRHGPLTLRSEVGGWHSVKLTVTNFDRIVAAEKARVRGTA